MGQGGSDHFHAQSMEEASSCPKASLHGTDAVWQELLHVGGGCLGQVGHGAKPATRCAVIQKSTDARRRILCQHGIICAEGFLFGF